MKISDYLCNWCFFLLLFCSLTHKNSSRVEVAWIFWINFLERDIPPQQEEMLFENLGLSMCNWCFFVVVLFSHTHNKNSSRVGMDFLNRFFWNTLNKTKHSSAAARGLWRWCGFSCTHKRTISWLITQCVFQQRFSRISRSGTRISFLELREREDG